MSARSSPGQFNVSGMQFDRQDLERIENFLAGYMIFIASSAIVAMNTVQL